MGIFDSLLGKTASNASNSAAWDTYAKQQKATEGLLEYGNEYADKYKTLAGAYDPYVSAGSGALGRLLQGLGLPGGDGSDFTAAYRSLPGYQSGLETGQNAALTAANAGGMLNSGKALKSLYRYGSDYEDQRSGDYLSRLMGLQGQGLSATQAQVGTEGQGLQGQIATRQSAYGGQMQSAPTIGQGMVAGAQAEQNALSNLMGTAAYLGGAALGGPVGGSLGSLMKSTPSSYGGGYYGGSPATNPLLRPY
jgi:hypothetical protein